MQKRQESNGEPEDAKWQKKPTVAGKLQSALSSARHLLVHLEPDGTLPIPPVGRLSRRNLGHVPAQGPDMEDVWCGAKRDLPSRLDVHGLGPTHGSGLVAPDRITVHISDGAVGLKVGRLAYVLPVCTSAELGERVYLYRWPWSAVHHRTPGHAGGRTVWGWGWCCSHSCNKRDCQCELHDGESFGDG